MYKHKQIIKLSVFQWWVGLITGLASMYLLLTFIYTSDSFALIYSAHIFQKPTVSFLFLLLACLLVPVNWFLEYKKWETQDLCSRISTHKKITGILLGSAVAAITPNRTGEYFGRLLVVPEKERYNTIYFGLTSSSAQFIINMSFGIAGLVFLLFTGVIQFAYSSLFIAMAVSIVFGLGTLLFFHRYMIQFLKQKLHTVVTSKLRLLTLSDKKILFRLLALSMMRYVVYFVQFYALMMMLGTTVSVWVLLSGMAAVFLLQSFVPVMGILEIGIKGSLALFVFYAYPAEQSMVITAFGVMWLINVVLPGLTGLTIWITYQVKKIWKNSGLKNYHF